MSDSQGFACGSVLVIGEAHVILTSALLAYHPAVLRAQDKRPIYVIPILVPRATTLQQIQ
jgi:hypothetical protein